MQPQLKRPDCLACLACFQSSNLSLGIAWKDEDALLLINRSLACWTHVLGTQTDQDMNSLMLCGNGQVQIDCSCLCFVAILLHCSSAA